MRHPERVEDYLEHIAQAIQRATEYVEHVGSVGAFQQSQLEQDAVIRNIESIGEAGRPSNLRFHRHRFDFPSRQAVKDGFFAAPAVLHLSHDKAPR